MKTTLYFGAPPSCLNFEKPKDLEEWLRQKDMEKRGALVPRRCISGEKGANGFKACSPEPHRHRVMLPARLSIFGRDENFAACDNHLQAYTKHGWLDMTPKALPKAPLKATVFNPSGRKLCTNCCTREATVNDTCEHCLDTVQATDPNGIARLINSGYCLNRDLVPGCNQYVTHTGQYCVFCVQRGFNSFDKEKNVGHRKGKAAEHSSAEQRALQPRVRTVSNSDRPCTITQGCTGRMSAAVRLMGSAKRPELWWNCATCKIPLLALKSRAIPDPDAVGASPAEPLNADMTDFLDVQAHLREMRSED